MASPPTSIDDLCYPFCLILILWYHMQYTGTVTLVVGTKFVPSMTQCTENTLLFLSQFLHLKIIQVKNYFGLLISMDQLPEEEKIKVNFDTKQQLI